MYREHFSIQRPEKNSGMSPDVTANTPDIKKVPAYNM